ncbi:MAG: SpoIID/LytB domain-containing protein [Ignavibacteria bacterium]|nr:SpoIID/LytB domain-containing protein [Ignavibacteria bacterium]
MQALKYNSVIISFLLLCMPLVNAQQALRNEQTKPAAVRVLIQHATEDIQFTVNAPLYLYSNDVKIALVKKNNIISMHAASRSFELTIQGKTFTANSFTFQPVSALDPLKYGGKEYSGSLRFVRTNTDIEVIDILPLEEYVKGVLAAELGKSDKPEMNAALQASAICVRTYTLKKLNNTKQEFDIEAGTQHQMFNGISRYPLINAAVESTHGQIITFNNELATVFYHSCCGGVTESVENAFTTAPIPYLVAVKDGDPAYCASSPVYSWKEEYTEREFLKLLKEGGLIQPRYDERIIAVEAEDRYPSGRIRNLVVRFSDGNITVVESGAFRTTFKRKNSAGILRSSAVTVTFDKNQDDGARIIFEGRGNGHGVGLCQWGSFGMSQKGSTAQEIIEHYFPGTSIGKQHD